MTRTCRPAGRTASVKCFRACVLGRSATRPGKHSEDCASSGLRRQICGVPSWGDRRVALAWAAASFLATERGYMKIRGHRRLQLLIDHLAQIEGPFGR